MEYYIYANGIISIKEDFELGENISSKILAFLFVDKNQERE